MNEIVLQSESTKAIQWTPEQVQLLKDTVCKGVTDDEFKVFCYAVKRTGLDPFMKQIHAVKRKNNKTGKEEMSIQTGIDGYRLIADRTEIYVGNDDPIFDDEIKPNKATVTVYKLIQGIRCPFTASARWDEYYPGDGGMGFMWRKMPCVMLGKVAEALALRKAFPADLSGVYTNDEMDQADRDREPVKQVKTFKNEAPQVIAPIKAQVSSNALLDRINPIVKAMQVKQMPNAQVQDHMMTVFGFDSMKLLNDAQAQELLTWVESQESQEQLWEKEMREEGPRPVITPVSPHELK